MNASPNTLSSLADIGRVETSGQIRRIGAQMLLALARKEIGHADIEAAAKMVMAQAAHMAAEVRVQRAAFELRAAGVNLAAPQQLGRTVISESNPATPDA